MAPEVWLSKTLLCGCPSPTLGAAERVSMPGVWWASTLAHSFKAAVDPTQGQCSPLLTARATAALTDNVLKALFANQFPLLNRLLQE